MQDLTAAENTTRSEPAEIRWQVQAWAGADSGREDGEAEDSPAAKPAVCWAGRNPPGVAFPLLSAMSCGVWGCYFQLSAQGSHLRVLRAPCNIRD